MLGPEHKMPSHTLLTSLDFILNVVGHTEGFLRCISEKKFFRTLL